MILKRAVGERQGIPHSQWKGEAQPLGGSAFRTLSPRSQPGSFVSSFAHGHWVAAEKTWNAEGPVALFQSYPYATQASPPSSGSWVVATGILSLKSHWTMSAESEPKTVFSHRNAEPITDLLKGSFRQKSERLSRVFFFHASMSTVIQANEQQAFIHSFIASSIGQAHTEQWLCIWHCRDPMKQDHSQVIKETKTPNFSPQVLKEEKGRSAWPL